MKNWNELKQKMKTYIDENRVAGATVIIREKGEILYEDSFGYKDMADKTPIDENSIFRLCSMTKPVTAVGIMKLTETGKLGLDDEISNYIPGFKNPQVAISNICMKDYQADKEYPNGRPLEDDIPYQLIPSKREITIRDLLNHSSGLGQGPIGNKFMYNGIREYDKLKDRVERWAGMPLDFHPGTGTGYSPIVGFDLLARIIEIVSEKEFSEYLKEEIFEPLDIHDMGFILNTEQKKRLVSLYEYSNGKLIKTENHDLDMLKPDNGYYSGAGGLLGSRKEYDKFVQMLTNEGIYQKSRILKPETVRKMHKESAAIHLEMKPQVTWGLGMAIFGEPELSGVWVHPGTFGWSGAFGTHFFIDPERKRSLLLMLNISNIGGADSYISREVEKLVTNIAG